VLAPTCRPSHLSPPSYPNYYSPMRPPVIVASAIVVLAVLAGVLYLASSPEPAPATPVARPAPTESAPVARTPEPTPEAAPSPRRTPAPVAEPTPAPIVPAKPTTGTLRIESDVEGATVFLDRMSVGTTPVTVPNVAPGSHSLSVSAAGFDRHSETIEVEVGERTVTVVFKEIKLNASVEAVHKHGMGSCKGRLVGSPQGVRYEAADGKDNVSVAFADITAFELDYLSKNVRLRTKQGRTFNFTESGGNLDKLAYFFQDVEKVRKRIGG
jgi:hypothetical protein